MPVVLEKARLNMWNLIGFACGIAVTAFGWGITYAKLDGAVSAVRADVVTIKRDTDTKFNNIETKLAPITSLQFQAARALEQVAEVKGANEETNKRIDRVVESFSGKLDTLNGGVNSLITKVEVLNSVFHSETRRRNGVNTPPAANQQ